jgi:hypothetical protein
MADKHVIASKERRRASIRPPLSSFYIPRDNRESGINPYAINGPPFFIRGSRGQ